MRVRILLDIIVGPMCIYIYFVLNRPKYYYIIIYGGSHASDILHVLMGSPSVYVRK